MAYANADKSDGKLITKRQLQLASERISDAINNVVSEISNLVITINQDTGNLEYESVALVLTVNQTTGCLEYSSKT